MLKVLSPLDLWQWLTLAASTLILPHWHLGPMTSKRLFEGLVGDCTGKLWPWNSRAWYTCWLCSNPSILLSTLLSTPLIPSQALLVPLNTNSQLALPRTSMMCFKSIRWVVDLLFILMHSNVFWHVCRSSCVVFNIGYIHAPAGCTCLASKPVWLVDAPSHTLNMLR